VDPVALAVAAAAERIALQEGEEDGDEGPVTIVHSGRRGVVGEGGSPAPFPAVAPAAAAAAVADPHGGVTASAAAAAIELSSEPSASAVPQPGLPAPLAPGAIACKRCSAAEAVSKAKVESGEWVAVCGACRDSLEATKPKLAGSILEHAAAGLVKAFSTEEDATAEIK
jgi:hypothetical protein